MLDVVIFDTVGQYGTKYLGGSEKCFTQLCQGLRDRGKSCIILQRETKVQCRTLVLSRYSIVPKNIQYSRIVNACHDQEESGIQWAPRVYVSDWQRHKRRRLLTVARDVVIHPMVDDCLYALRDLDLPKQKGQWIYASALHKGLNQALREWVGGQGIELNVTNTYDDMAPHEMARGVYWCGKSTPYQLARRIATSEGLFYPHTYPECFPIVVYLAKLYGLQIYAPCVDHTPCGITEALAAGDLSMSTIMPKWLEVLRVPMDA